MVTKFLPQILIFLAVVNVWTIFCFWRDKASARQGERRIREADLLGLALIGGSPGALLARRLFRHKTRKEPFSTRLLIIVVLQLGGSLGVLATCAPKPI